jgi:hypothetical protein
MSRPDYSILYSAPVAPSVTSGLKGQAVIPSDDPNDRGRYVVATAANRGTRRSTGVALANFAASGAVNIQQSGELDAATSGLAAGAVSWVRVSSTGYLERVTTPVDADDVVGRAEADGTVRLMFGILTASVANGGSATVADDIAKSAGTAIDRVQGIRGRTIAATAPGAGEAYVYNSTDAEWQPGKPTPPSWFNVKDYGAVGDGVTDDLAAFEAAMAAMGPVASGVARHKVLYVPEGDYYFSDDLKITRALYLTGAGGGGSGYAAARLTFAPYKGIRIYSWTNSPDRGDAAYTVVEDLDIIGAHDNGAATPPHLHATWQAATAYAVGDKIVCAATRATASENSYEYYFECVDAGTTGATEPDWGNVLFHVDQSALWQASTAYYQFNVVRTAGRFDVYFEVTSPTGVTTSGTSGGVVPAAFATAIAGDTVVDGGVTWTCRSAQFYFATDGGVVWACKVAAGIYSQARMTIRQCAIRYFLTAGIHVQASYAYFPYSNANGFTIENVKSHYNGVGILTRGDECNASYIYMLDVIGWDQSDREIGIAERGFLGNRYVACQVASVLGPGYLQTGPNNTGAFIGCYAEGSMGLNDIRNADFQILGGTWGTGFTAGSVYTGWTTSNDWRGVQTRATNGARTIASSNRIDAQSLTGYTVDSSAFYLRLTYDSTAEMWQWQWANSSDYTAYAIDSGQGGLGGGAVLFPRGYFEGTTDKRLVAADIDASKSYRLRGGLRNVGDRRYDNSLIAGGYIGEVVTVAGYSGPAWSASAAYSPSTRGPLGLFARIVTPVVANGYAYRCVKEGTSGSGEPVWPTVVAAEEYRTWTPGYYVELGDFIRPTTPNAHVYEVTAITGDYVVMGTEPTWPTGAGATLVADGVTYTEVGADPTTTYVTDGTVIWECCGVEATWKKFGAIVP